MTRTVVATALAFASVTAGVAVAQADRGPAATIRYTEYGIPHVVANDYAGVGFGQGYAAARDHLCTIVEGAVSLDGRRSEYFGPDGRPAGTVTTAATNLSSDLYFRGVNESRVIERLVSPGRWWTRYGPVVSGVRGVALPWTGEKAYALADPNAQNMRLLNTLFEFNRAQSVPEFVAAAKRTQGASVFNMLATDSAGRTAYSGASVVPNVTDELANRCNTDLGKQTFPATGLAVLDGSRTSCAWGTDRDAVQPGTFGPGNLPMLERADYVVNANESYWLTNADAPMKRYPRILGTWEQQRNVRTRGALTEITDQLAKGPFDLRATQDLVLSNRSMAAELARTDTVTMCHDLGVDVADACTALANWDGRSNVDSRGALLFSRYWNKIGRLPSTQLWQVPFDVTDPVHTPNTLNTANPVVRKAFLDAVQELRTANIPADAPLGEYQYTERGGDRFPIGGGRPEMGVFNVVASDWDGGYPAIGASMGSNSTSYLHVVAFDGDRCPEARTLMAYSQSSDPLSPHHADQTALFSRGQWVTERFCERDIQRSPNLEVLEVGR